MNGTRSLLTTLPRGVAQPRTREALSQCIHQHIRALQSPLERTLHSDHIRRPYTSGSEPTKTSSDDPTTAKSEPVFPDPRDPRQHPLADLSIEEVLADTRALARNKAQQQRPVYHRKLTESGEAYAIGRRKRSEARVWLREGSGVITVNDQPWIEYFPRVDHRDKVLRPLDLLDVVGRFDIRCRVYGGGINGQTEAVRHGIARALQNWDPHMRPSLKQDGLLTRDSRVVEPKKYGRKKARKSFTWVKR